jgi:hypothetical protein
LGLPRFLDYWLIINGFAYLALSFTAYSYRNTSNALEYHVPGHALRDGLHAVSRDQRRKTADGCSGRLIKPL